MNFVAKTVDDAWVGENISNEELKKVGLDDIYELTCDSFIVY